MTNALASMTGFARTEGRAAGLAWAWELRSVNGRGLDVRLRLPPGWDALEPALREATGKSLKRGNVTASLAVKRESESRLVADPAALEQALALALDLHGRIPGSPPPRAESLLALPGVLRPAQADETIDATAATEGFGRALAALLREAPSLPEERIAQEVALLAARSDVREELDRLASHIEAARALLREAANIGRRFDFLVQEFNREANTLCRKSASVALTATGLRLKATIEQMREQVQNIE